MEKLESQNDNKNKQEIVLAEYSAIKSELNEIFQKAAMLLVIVCFVLSIITSIAYFLANSLNNPYLLLICILDVSPLISIIFLFFILVPNLKNSPNSKYFLDFAKIPLKNDNWDESCKLLDNLITINNIKTQIIINSQILIKKYKYYKYAINCLFFYISIFKYMFSKIIQYIKRKNK